MRAARSNRVTRVAPMINSHAPLLGLAVRPPCSCLRWPFVGVTALHAERRGTLSDVSARNESCTPVWWVGRDHSSSSVSLRPRMAVSFGFEVVPYGLSGEWRHGDNAPIAVCHVRVQNRAGVSMTVTCDHGATATLSPNVRAGGARLRPPQTAGPGSKCRVRISISP